MAEILFDESAHRYTVDGIIRPSVTTILKEFGLYPDYQPDPKYMERGTAVHKLTELYDQGEVTEQGWEEWRRADAAVEDPFWKLTPYLDAYLQFLMDFSPTWTHIESRVFSANLNVCGTLDRAGIINGKRCVLDIKATNSMPATCTGLQLAAYVMMHALPDFRSVSRIGLALSDDGKYKIAYYEDPNDFDMFVSAARLYHWKKERHL